MAINIFPQSVDTKGNLSSSVAPSSDNSLVNKSYADATISVTVSSSKFVLDGVSQGTASLQKSVRFKFDLSDSSNSGHPLRFSETSDGSHGGGSEYTTGVTVSGTPGQSGAHVIIETSQATPDLLYYYCSSHSGMGGEAQSASVGSLIHQSSGKVGIGVESPSRSLDVSGDVKVRGGDILGSHTSLPAIQMDSNSNVTIPQNLTIGSGKTITINGVTYTFPSSDGSSGQFLSTNGSGTLSFASASGGGGSSSSTFAIRLAGVFATSSTSSTRVFTHSSGMGNAMGGSFNLTRTDIGSTSNTTFTTTALQASHYYTVGVIPFGCTLDSVSMWVQWRYTYSNSPKYRVWKGTYTDGTAGDVTWTQIFDAETVGANSSTTNAIDFSKKTLSSGNTFSEGDIVGFTFETGGSASSSTNQFTTTMMFTES